MKILGIDTSCDDTCISLLKIQNFEIISNVVSSQVKLHAKYGGVYPSLAKREHQKNLPIVFKKATKGIDTSKTELPFMEAKVKMKTKSSSPIDLIGVTIGPGLEPCLWTGVNFAKELAEKLKKPLILVNHIEAHIMANWLKPIRQIQNLFPAICLVVSGGHTQLILMRDIGKYELVGETRDDAAGECFDKAARILGLGYPGGPIISKLAKKINNGSRTSIILPRPMMYQKNYDFSFSGLKTAVLYDFRSRSSKIRKSKEYIRSMCAEIQQAIIDVLIHKTLKAAKNYYKVKSIILGGGVVANTELRKQFKEKIEKELKNVKFFIPETEFCTDNAAMVAITAFFNQKKKTKNWKKIKANANLRI